MQVTGIAKALIEVVSMEETARRTVTSPATALLRSIAQLHEREVKRKSDPYTQQQSTFQLSQ